METKEGGGGGGSQKKKFTIEKEKKISSMRVKRQRRPSSQPILPSPFLVPDEYFCHCVVYGVCRSGTLCHGALT